MLIRSGCWAGLVTALVHSAASLLALWAGFAYLVPFTRIAESIVVVAVFISFPLLVQGMLALTFGGYRRVPELGWVLTLMAQAFGAFFILLIASFGAGKGAF